MDEAVEDGRGIQVSLYTYTRQARLRVLEGRILEHLGRIIDSKWGIELKPSIDALADALADYFALAQGEFRKEDSSGQHQ